MVHFGQFDRFDHFRKRGFGNGNGNAKTEINIKKEGGSGGWT